MTTRRIRTAAAATVLGLSGIGGAVAMAPSASANDCTKTYSPDGRKVSAVCNRPAPPTGVYRLCGGDEGGTSCSPWKYWGETVSLAFPGTIVWDRIEHAAR